MDVSRTWCLIDEEPGISSSSCPIVGYNTLTTYTVMREDLPNPSKYPTYSLPVIRLAWLGVAREYQRSSMHVGEILLIEAFNMAFAWYEATLSLGLVVDPLTDRVMCFSGAMTSSR